MNANIQERLALLDPNQKASAPQPAALQPENDLTDPLIGNGMYTLIAFALVIMLGLPIATWFGAKYLSDNPEVLGNLSQTFGAF